MHELPPQLVHAAPGVKQAAEKLNFAFEQRWPKRKFPPDDVERVASYAGEKVGSAVCGRHYVFVQKVTNAG
jgi:hypothetical protein